MLNEDKSTWSKLQASSDLHEVVVGIEYFKDWTDEGVGDAKQEDVICKPIGGINVILDESIGNDGDEDGIDHLGNHTLDGEAGLMISLCVILLEECQPANHL